MLVYKSRFTRHDLSGRQRANRTNSLTPDLQPLREMKICMPDYISTDVSQVGLVLSKKPPSQSKFKIKIGYPLNTRTILRSYTVEPTNCSV